MFTWICPKCGTEVPPAHSECPNCAIQQQSAAGVPVSAPPPIPAAPPPALPPQAPPQAPPQQYYAPPAAPVATSPSIPAYPNVPPPEPVQLPPPEMRRPPKPAGVLFGVEADPSAPAAPPFANAPYTGGPQPESGLPSWAVAILSLLAVGVVGFGAYYLFSSRSASASPADEAKKASAPVEQAENSHPVAKFVEVAGFRIIEDKQKVQLKFLVVNHSSGEIGGFDLDLHVKLRTAKPEDPPLFTVKAPIRSIGPWESKDFTVPASTTLRAYELPDWQFLTATFQITGQ